VFFVTRSLRNGFVNDDSMFDLQQRLESLPTDLEPFFKHMLDMVELFYYQRMAQVLRTAINAKKSFTIELYQIQEYEDDDIDYAMNKPIDLHSSEQLEAALAQSCRRINARCGGLLEIKKDHVEFLHRTVRDYLLTREMHEYLCIKSG
jgi:hypothetical protein